MFSWSTFLLYAFVSTITPGPNNIMSMSLGSRIGFSRTLTFNAGVFMGFCTVMLLCTFFCTSLNSFLPQMRLPMLVAGTAYLLWLAWKILRSTYQFDNQKQTGSNRFLEGMVLQFLNVKIFVYGIMSMQIFIIPHFDAPLTLGLFAILLAAIGCSCNLVWSAFGAVFRRLFSRYTKIINIVLALSLVICAVSLW